MIKIKLRRFDTVVELQLPTEWFIVRVNLWQLGLDRDPAKYTLEDLDAVFSYDTSWEHQMIRLIDVRYTLEDAIKLYVAGEALIHYSRLKEMAVQYGLAVLIVQRSVGSKYALDFGRPDQAACISDVIEAHFALYPSSYNRNQALLQRSSRVYGNAAWEIVHRAKSNRWELKE